MATPTDQLALLQKFGPELARFHRLAARQQQLALAAHGLARVRKAQQIFAENRALIAQAGKAARLAADPTRASALCEARPHVTRRAHRARRVAGRPAGQRTSRGSPSALAGGDEPPGDADDDVDGRPLDALAGRPV